MQNKQPLLSICIPTYNRSKYLEDALYNIIKDEAFSDEIEIVISDNASTDNTQEIVQKYISQYSNVKYFRNERNVKDENFILSLKRSKGKYVRLFNDTLRLKKGALSKILNIITNSSDKVPLYIYQNISYLECKSKLIRSIDDFLETTSFMTTWIGNMGNWRIYIDLIEEADRFSNLKLPQVDWNYQIVAKSNLSKIEFGDFFTTSEVKNKGGYNLYEVFITNYLKILRSYNFTKTIISKEKYYLLKYFIIPWSINIYSDKNLTFSCKNRWSIMLKEYWNKPYFYLEISRLLIYSVAKFLKGKI